MADNKASQGQDVAKQLQDALQQLMNNNKPADKVTMPASAPIVGDASNGSSTATTASPSTAQVSPQKAVVSPGDLVTQAIANQGQLIPSSGNSSGKSSDKSQISAILNTLNNLTDSGSSSSSSSSKGGGALSAVSNIAGAASAIGGLGEAIGTAGSVIPAVAAGGFSVPAAAVAGSGILGTIGEILPILAWIICTELVRQNRMSRKWWIVGANVFANYNEIGKQGYFIWAVPSVQHLRAHPYSLYSRFLCCIFNWRAENIAAHCGVKGAKKNWKGAVVTAVLYPICWTIGHAMWLFNYNINWQSVYSDEVK